MPRQRGGGLGEVSKQQGSGNKSPSQKTRPWAWPSAGLGGNGGREEAGGGGHAVSRSGEAWWVSLRVGLYLQAVGPLWECLESCL